MANEFIYQMIGCEKVLQSGRKILEPTWLSFFPDAKIGVIGHNGAGKSTVLRIMAGLDEAFNGQAFLKPGATVGFLPQEPQLDPTRDVRGNIEQAVRDTRALLDEFERVSERFGEELTDAEMDALCEEQAKLQDRIDAADAWDLDRKVEVAMDALRVPPGDADVTVLSGGEKRRVALCRLDNVAHWILELDHGKAYPYEGNYSGWLEQKQERLRQQKKAETKRAKFLEQELAWIRSSPRARQSKSKARVSAYDALVSNQGDARRGTGATITIPLTKRLGNKVMVAQGVRKAFGEKLLMDELDFELPPGGIVGIIGPNGAGKTTLMRMIVGAEGADRGSLTLGETVDLGYVDQSRDALSDDKTVWESISGGAETITIGTRDVNSRAYVSQFNFRGADQQQKVGTLSGGERNRVHLARLLRKGCNVLLLDEPTNDLDVETLRNLEEALLEFPGCVVVTSHDRFFLDRIATHILAYEGDSNVVWFEGNYQAYEKDRRARMGEDADRPRRIKYRKFAD